MLTNIVLDAYYCSMTVQEAYQDLLIRLGGIYDNREAAVMANLVVEHLTGFGNSSRVVNKAVLLSKEQQVLIHKYAAQLLANKPLQYVLQEAPFYGLKLYVDESVLIPRPETEELVEWIIEETTIHYLKFNIQCSILDIGTGSGCIPVALKKHLPLMDMYAIDVSADALQVAKKNAAIHNTAIHFSQLDILNKSLWHQLPQFDLIVSNPPYITQQEAADMHNNVLQHEPHIALFVPDEDPLLFYKTIAAFSLKHLNKNGQLFFEINELYGAAISDMLAATGYKSIVLKKDMQGKDRMIKAQLS